MEAENQISKFILRTKNLAVFFFFCFSLLLKLKITFSYFYFGFFLQFFQLISLLCFVLISLFFCFIFYIIKVRNSLSLPHIGNSPWCVGEFVEAAKLYQLIDVPTNNRKKSTKTLKSSAILLYISFLAMIM